MGRQITATLNYHSILENWQQETRELTAVLNAERQLRRNNELAASSHDEERPEGNALATDYTVNQIYCSKQSSM
jgi:hypothetical protein